MDNRTRWSVGLEWGACAWLAYVAFRASTAAVAPLFRWAHLGSWPSAFAWLMAPVWVAALVSVCLRFAHVPCDGRCGDLRTGRGRDDGSSRVRGDAGLAFALRFFGPMSLPLLPLVVRPAVEPRAALGLLANGRWREAIGRFGGVRAGLAAVALIPLNRGAYDLLVKLQ